jgi:hypothetical protein
LGEMPQTDDDLLSLLVADSIADMVRAASGDTMHLDQGEVYEGVQGLVERLFGIPGQSSYTIPVEFWQSDFGSIVLAALVWSQGDELITISAAAEISGRSVASISNMAKRGSLKQYIEVSEPNPQRRMRVLRSEIEALKKPQ